MQCQTGSHLEPVDLVVLSLSQVVVSVVLDDHVAGRTRATATARMLEMNSEMHAHVEQGFGLPMPVIRKMPGLELHSPALRQERHFWHVGYCSAESGLSW